MTCNDCINSKTCKYMKKQIPLCDCTYEETNNVERSGCPFEKKPDRKDYVILELTHYIDLLQKLKTNREVKPTLLNKSDMLFLSAVLDKLHEIGNHEMTVYNNNVNIKVYNKSGLVIDSTFDISICKKYYLRVSAFIDEVL